MDWNTVINLSITVGIFAVLGVGLYLFKATKDQRENFFGDIGVAVVRLIMLSILVGVFYGVYKIVASSR